MALVLKDRVQETTTTTGTGTLTLGGAVTGYQSFSAIGNANTTYYAIYANGGSEWEVGIGTYTASGTTLSRDTVLASSNSGSLVNFSAGTKNVWCDYPAGKAVYTDSSGNVTGYAISNGTINGTTIGATSATTGAFTTVTASTSLTTPTVQATSSAGLSLKNTGGTTQMLMGAGGGDNLAINVSTNLNGTNAQIDISPTGTGHVHINPTGVNSIQVNPTYVGTMDNITIGATTPKNGSFVDLSVTGITSFDGSQGTSGQVLTSAGTGATPTWTTPTTGTVTSVTGTSPVVSSGGATPAISMPAATTSVNGYLTSTDWNTFNSKGSGTVTSVSGTAPVVSSGGATPAISMAAANTTTNGYLTSTDWNTFNGKGSGTVTSVAALTLGTTGTDLSSTVATGTTTPVITLQVPTASASNRGALSSTDWSTFNGKAPAVTYTTNYVPFGQGTTTPNLSSNFTYTTGTSTLSAPTVSSSNGVFSTPNGNLGAGNATVFKNRIINGDMRIDQRNAGASVTPTATGTYTLDRWITVLSQSSKFSVQQNAGSVTPPAGYINYLGVTSLSAYTVGSTELFLINQRIEGLNVADLGWGTANAQTVTLSFWVRSSLTGTFGGSLKNSASDRSYPFSYTISSANTWEQKSITIAGDTTGTWLTTNGIGIQLSISLGSGSTVSGTAGSWTAGNYVSTTGATSVVGTNGATFYITGVQLEVGSSATGFNYVDYGTQFFMCQRYYYKVFPNAAGSLLMPSGGSTSTTTAAFGISFPASMRIAPTALEQSGTAAQYTVWQAGIGGTALNAVPTFVVSNADQAVVSAGVASGLTQFNPAQLRTTASTGAPAYLAWSAEL